MKSFIFKSIIVGGLALSVLSLVQGQSFNVNLIVNPGAEASTGAITSWTSVSGAAQAVNYGASGGFPTATDAGPASRGLNFFAGGESVAFSEITQKLDLTADHAAIALGTVGLTLSGYFGGFQDQRDFATLTAKFFDAANTLVGSVSVGNVSNTERNNLSGLLFRTTDGLVPVTAASVLFALDSTRMDGSYDDGYADNLSFVLTAAVTPPPPASAVPEPSTYGLFAGVGLVVAAMIRRRKANSAR